MESVLRLLIVPRESHPQSATGPVDGPAENKLLPPQKTQPNVHINGHSHSTLSHQLLFNARLLSCCVRPLRSKLSVMVPNVLIVIDGFLYRRGFSVMVPNVLIAFDGFSYRRGFSYGRPQVCMENVRERILDCFLFKDTYEIFSPDRNNLQQFHDFQNFYYVLNFVLAFQNFLIC